MYWNEHLVKVALAKLLFFTTVLNLFCDNTGKKIRCFMHFLKKKVFFFASPKAAPPGARERQWSTTVKWNFTQLWVRTAGSNLGSSFPNCVTLDERHFESFSSRAKWE